MGLTQRLDGCGDGCWSTTKLKRFEPAFLDRELRRIIGGPVSMADQRIRLRTHQFDLPLRHPFTISRGTVTAQPTLIVELDDGQHQGFGEATTNDYYGMTMPRMLDALEQVREVRGID